MANAFSKEEKVAFDQLLEGFNDALVMSRNVNVYNYNQTDAARTTAMPGASSHGARATVRTFCASCSSTPQLIAG